MFLPVKLCPFLTVDVMDWSNLPRNKDVVEQILTKLPKNSYNVLPTDETKAWRGSFKRLEHT